MDVVRQFVRGSAVARDAIVAAAGLAAVLLWVFLVNLAPFPLWYVSVAALLAVFAAALAVLVYILAIDAVIRAVYRRAGRAPPAYSPDAARVYWGTQI